MPRQIESLMAGAAPSSPRVPSGMARRENRPDRITDSI